MNCREAHSNIFAERDGALENSQRTALDSHLAQCDGCRKVRENLTSVLAGWRIEVSQATIPDAEREWHAVRRRIRGGVDSGAARDSRPRRNLFTWIAVPVGATAALAFALLVSPFHSPTIVPADHAGEHIAHANSVDVSGSSAPSMVFVDDKSGWLFVWASDAQPKSG